jgi:chromosome segregation protein
MDEVEAALDDMNLHRFLDLVAEFRREAQLIIVSHQKHGFGLKQRWFCRC